MEIQMDILRAVANGREKPTHIMYRANLSWIRLQKMLDTLTSHNLLREVIDSGNTIYVLTQKGKEVLGYYIHIVGEFTKKKTPIPLYIKSR
jgi:predicted transcriptional regulator